MFEMFKKILNRILIPQQIHTLREMRKLCYKYLYTHDLAKQAMVFNSDKWDSHRYISHYVEHFHKLRDRKLRILEIGAGGYRDSYSGGNSLRMWKGCFSKSMIYSIDIYNKESLQEKRIKIFQGSQADEIFLKDIGNQIGPLDIIIDDGSHIVSHVLASFKTLFPFLKDGGIYVIEDTQTSYWPSFGGNSEGLNNFSTSMDFFKSLADGLNYQEFLRPNYTPSYFDKHVIAVYFYHNIIFIYKGQNNEGSNMVENGKFTWYPF